MGCSYSGLSSSLEFDHHYENELLDETLLFLCEFQRKEEIQWSLNPNLVSNLRVLLPFLNETISCEKIIIEYDIVATFTQTSSEDQFIVQLQLLRDDDIIETEDLSSVSDEFQMEYVILDKTNPVFSERKNGDIFCLKVVAKDQLITTETEAIYLNLLDHTLSNKIGVPSTLNESKHFTEVSENKSTSDGYGFVSIRNLVFKLSGTKYGTPKPSVVHNNLAILAAKFDNLMIKSIYSSPSKSQFIKPTTAAENDSHTVVCAGAVDSPQSPHSRTWTNSRANSRDNSRVKPNRTLFLTSPSPTSPTTDAKNNTKSLKNTTSNKNMIETFSNHDLFSVHTNNNNINNHNYNCHNTNTQSSPPSLISPEKLAFKHYLLEQNTAFQTQFDQQLTSQVVFYRTEEVFFYDDIHKLLVNSHGTDTNIVKPNKATGADGCDDDRDSSSDSSSDNNNSDLHSDNDSDKNSNYNDIDDNNSNDNNSECDDDCSIPNSIDHSHNHNPNSHTQRNNKRVRSNSFIYHTYSYRPTIHHRPSYYSTNSSPSTHTAYNTNIHNEYITCFKTTPISQLYTDLFLSFECKDCGKGKVNTTLQLVLMRNKPTKSKNNNDNDDNSTINGESTASRTRANTIQNMKSTQLHCSDSSGNAVKHKNSPKHSPKSPKSSPKVGNSQKLIELVRFNTDKTVEVDYSDKTVNNSRAKSNSLDSDYRSTIKHNTESIEIEKTATAAANKVKSKAVAYEFLTIVTHHYDAEEYHFNILSSLVLSKARVGDWFELRRFVGTSGGTRGHVISMKNLHIKLSGGHTPAIGASRLTSLTAIHQQSLEQSQVQGPRHSHHRHQPKHFAENDINGSDYEEKCSEECVIASGNIIRFGIGGHSPSSRHGVIGSSIGETNQIEHHMEHASYNISENRSGDSNSSRSSGLSSSKMQPSQLPFKLAINTARSDSNSSNHSSNSYFYSPTNAPTKTVSYSDLSSTKFNTNSSNNMICSNSGTNFRGSSKNYHGNNISDPTISMTNYSDNSDQHADINDNTTPTNIINIEFTHESQIYNVVVHTRPANTTPQRSPVTKTGSTIQNSQLPLTTTTSAPDSNSVQSSPANEYGSVDTTNSSENRTSLQAGCTTVKTTHNSHSTTNTAANTINLTTLPPPVPMNVETQFESTQGSNSQQINTLTVTPTETYSKATDTIPIAVDKNSELSISGIQQSLINTGITSGTLNTQQQLNARPTPLVKSNTEYFSNFRVEDI